MRLGVIGVVAGTCALVVFWGGCQATPDRMDAAERARWLSVGAPKQYVCFHTSSPIEVDGRLDDAAWERAPWTSYFVDIEGHAKPAPRFQTRMRMLWDDRYLYVAVEMEEPHVWGTLRNHDDIIFQDNDFEIFLDPDGDLRDYYEIEINALGTIFDLVLEKPYLAGGPADHGWDATGLLHAVHVDGTLNDPSDTDNGWSVELGIPWRVFAEPSRKPLPPLAGDIWRVNCSRVQWRHEVAGGSYRKVAGERADNWVWSPQGVVNMHLPQYWGFVEFRR